MGLAIIGAVVAVVGTVNSVIQQQEAKKNAGRAADEQRKTQMEQRAAQARQQAEEKRKMVREERVRRAKILQSSENTGVSGSSGETGALGSLSTQLSTNIGSNLGAKQNGENISRFSQNAADFGTAANFNMQEANQWNQAAAFGGNIFDAAGGGNIFSSTKSTSDPIGDFYQKGNRGAGD